MSSSEKRRGIRRGRTRQSPMACRASLLTFCFLTSTAHLSIHILTVTAEPFLWQGIHRESSSQSSSCPMHLRGGSRDVYRYIPPPPPPPPPHRHTHVPPPPPRPPPLDKTRHETSKANTNTSLGEHPRPPPPPPPSPRSHLAPTQRGVPDRRQPPLPPPRPPPPLRPNAPDAPIPISTTTASSSSSSSLPVSVEPVRRPPPPPPLIPSQQSHPTTVVSSRPDRVSDYAVQAPTTQQRRIPLSKHEISEILRHPSPPQPQPRLREESSARHIHNGNEYSDRQSDDRQSDGRQRYATPDKNPNTHSDAHALSPQVGSQDATAPTQQRPLSKYEISEILRHPSPPQPRLHEESSARYIHNGNETPGRQSHDRQSHDRQSHDRQRYDRQRYATTDKNPNMHLDAHAPPPQVGSQLFVEETSVRRPIQIQRQQQHWLERDESSLLSSYFTFPEKETTLLLRPLLTTMLRDVITEFEQQDYDEDQADWDDSSISQSDKHSRQRPQPPLRWAALLLDSALPFSQTPLLQFAAETSWQTAHQQDDLLQLLWERILLSSSIPPENNEVEPLPDMHAASSGSGSNSSRLQQPKQKELPTTTTKQQTLSAKEPRRIRVVKTRSVPRQTLLSALSDYDADLGDSEFEELLQDMQLPTYATEEYEEYDQVMSDSDEEDEEPDDDMYEDYYDHQEVQNDAMFELHQPLRHSQKWAVVDLGHATGREWQPAKLYLPRKGVLEHDIRYDSDDLEQDEVLDETDFEVLRESNEIEWFDFETLDNILLGEDELDLLSDSDDLELGDDNSEASTFFKSSEVGLPGTSNDMDQGIDESPIPFDGVGIDENQYDLESIESNDYDREPLPTDAGDETKEIGLIDEPIASLTQESTTSMDDHLEEPNWKIIESFRKPFRSRLFRFWEWSMFHRLGQTQKTEGENSTTSASDYANVDPIDAFPTETNTLLDDLKEVEEDFDEMNLGDSAVDSCEHHQRSPPSLSRASDYLPSQKTWGFL